MSAPQRAAQAQTSATAQTYQIDPAHSVAGFSIKHLMVSTVTGRFNKLAGTLHLDEHDAARSRVEADIEAASIDTGVGQRDDHLRSADFFHAAEHPKLTFRSTRVVQSAPDAARVHGELTIRGVTREVALDVTRDGVITDPWGNHRMGFTAETSLSRKDFGLTWNQLLEAGGVMVGDKVKITLNIEAVRAKAG